MRGHFRYIIKPPAVYPRPRLPDFSYHISSFCVKCTPNYNLGLCFVSLEAHVDKTDKSDAGHNVAADGANRDLV